jgi:hypothetical protein
MTNYSFVLLIHVTAVLGLTAVLTVEALSLYHLRRASGVADASLWIDLVRMVRPFAIGALLIILLSAIYLVIPVASFQTAWPKVAVASLFLMGPLGALTGRRMRAIRQSVTFPETNHTKLLGGLRDPFLKISLFVRIAVFFGIFLLVSIKPGLLASVSLIGACVAFGLLLYRLSFPSAKRVITG